ncbi:replication factor-a protein 1 subfamily protein [Babesia caballi]|uniref:Replication protein A subunit n=1 Tax=Babesia caballi TaxID=5871 RepID=A0AAV4LTF5_BABCB|nr:replication factor-a protein 1 subfamily protein [Babesia caballi]
MDAQDRGGRRLGAGAAQAHLPRAGASDRRREQESGGQGHQLQQVQSDGHEVGGFGEAFTWVRSRYLVILTKISILPGDYRHLTSHLGSSLVYHPGLCIQQQSQAAQPAQPAQPPAAATTQTQCIPAAGSAVVRNVDDGAAPLKRHAVAQGPQGSKPVVKVGDAGGVTPIKISELTVYTPKWMIRARVTNKTQIRKFNNQWGEGQLFSIDLCDADGEIRATFFGEAVTKWFYFIEEGQVYSISGGQIKAANKRFNNLNHSCEISLDENAQIQLFQNDQSIPAIRCSFTPINQIESLNVGTIIDVIGIVVKTRDSRTVQQKSGGTVEKRDVMLCDNSGATIWLTLWGGKVQQFQNRELEGHPLIAFKGVKVGDWQGKRLDTQGSTKITVEPEMQQAVEIKQWWDTTGSQMRFDGGRAAGDANIEDIKSIRLINQAANQALQFKSLGDTGITFTTRAMIEVIRESTFSWPACPECFRKMNRDQGSWACPRCNSRLNPRHTYILSIKIADDTGHLWATASGFVADEIMSWVPAEELLGLFENGDVNADGKNFMNVFEEARLTEYIFKVKVTSEKYMDEHRVRYKLSKALKMSKYIDAAITCRLNEIKELL